MKVVYGHTDSIYVQIDSVETAQGIIKEIESSVRESFPNVMGLDEHPVVLEFEKYFSALGVGVTMNRNAGMITWEDGNWLDEPKFIMTGFTAKRVSETPFSKGIQTHILKMWVTSEKETDILSYLHNKYVETINGKIELKNLVKRSRLKPSRFMVKCDGCKAKYHIKDCLKIEWCGKCSADTKKFVTLEGKKPTFGSGIAGVLYCWEKKDVTFDDSYLFIKVKDVNDTYTHPLTKENKSVEYVSGTTYSDLEGYTVDWEHYAEQVVKKAEPIYKAMNWDLSSIRTGRIQKKLDDWW